MDGLTFMDDLPIFTFICFIIFHGFVKQPYGISIAITHLGFPGRNNQSQV